MHRLPVRHDAGRRRGCPFPAAACPSGGDLFVSGRQLFVLGLRHGLPIVLGYVPVAMAYAVAALEAGFSPLQTIVMSACVYSGSGQVLGVAMGAQQAGLLAIAAATFIISFRYFIMAASLFSRLPGLHPLQRVLTAFFITDETFALMAVAPQPRARLSYALGIIAVSYCSWVAGTVAGVMAQALLPPLLTAALGIALYALFIALIMPAARSSAAMAALVAGTAVLNAALSALMGGAWSMAVSTVLAAALGAWLMHEVPGEDDRDG